MATSKPNKKGFSMSLGKSKSSSLSAKARPDGGDRLNPKSSVLGGVHQEEGGEEEPKKDYVTGIGGGKVVTKEKIIERGPRVIALASNPWEREAAAKATGARTSAVSSPTTTPSPAALSNNKNGRLGPRRPSPTTADNKQKEKSLDQLAAEEIARESRAESGGRHRDGDAHERHGLGLDSDRVIGMAVATAAGAGDGSTADPTTTAGRGKKTGLLENNMIPGLAEVEGEDAKFRHDLGHRAEDVSVRSKTYVDVPVSEFGAALLRGMGWQGPDEAGVGGGGGPDLGKDVEPRHHRLGLGAQPKPPEEMKKPRKRKPGEKPRASDEARLKIWEQKVKEEKEQASRPKPAQLSVLDVVEVSGDDSREGGRGRRPRRAMVLQTQGVPGLNKISVRMEDSGEKVLVDKSSAMRVSDDELARRPFSDEKRPSSDEKRPKEGGISGGGEESPSTSKPRGADGNNKGTDNGGYRDQKRGGSKMTRSRSKSRSLERDNPDGDRRDGKKQKRSKKEKKKHKKSSSSSKRERDERASQSPPPYSDEDIKYNKTNREPDSRDRHTDSRGRYNTSPNRKRPRDGSDKNNDVGKYVSNGSGRETLEPTWLRNNIRVRVVHKSYAGGRAYLGKGTVVDVPCVGEATVSMDLGSLVLEGVKQRHLETVLPTRGGKVIVVRGQERGTTGKLLAKDKESGTALVQVFEDLRAVKLSLDDVAEFTGTLDDNVDDVGY